MKTFMALMLSGFLLTDCVVAAEPRAVPGEVLTLEFSDLPKMHGDLTAACEVSIPKNYDPAKPVPLLVWFTGGKGSNRIAGANGVVDFDRFVVVALPYPNGHDMRTAIKGGGMEAVRTYHQAMMDRMTVLLPNIDPRVRIAAGSSNGAHLIGTALSLEWAGFADYFTLFVLHEGGSAASNKYPGAKDKRLLVIWGEKSEALKWQLLFNWRIGQAGARISYHSVPDAAHGLNERGRVFIRTWIDEAIAPVPAH
jgi:hypothetical protein